MTFPAKHVANCFLQRDFEDGCATITPMKLQKLVYCLHGWHLAIEGVPAINEPFEAWQYGPVEDGLYHNFKPFRNNPISSYASTGAGEEKKSYVVARQGHSKFYEILDFVAEKYMPLNALQLSALTHQDGTPWSITRENDGTAIDNALIKAHFKALVTG